MPKTELTPAEKEAERKRQADAWWQKVILYYLNQFYHEQVDKELEEAKAESGFQPAMLSYIREKKLVDKLTAKEPGKLSCVELLERMEKYQEEDSPFSSLLRNIKENPEREDKIEESLSRVVEEGPKRILRRGRRNAFHKKRPQAAREPAPRDEQDPEEAERTRYEMTFLRAVMPGTLYKALCDEMVKQGRMKDPEREFLFVPDEPERGGITYEEYAAKHVARPAEREGGGSNLDEVYTAAAYQLAAYEQKNAARFNEQKADARAMELSGSKAFRAYVKEHPGTLLGAAQKTGLEVTQKEFAALEKKLKDRDATLGAVRDAMRASSGGKSAAYHKLVNAMDRFVSSPEEPGNREKNDLSLQLAQFLMTEGAPGGAGYNWETGMMTAKALKALLPKKDFDAFLLQANLTRAPEEKLDARALDAYSIPSPQTAPQRSGPVLERNDDV